MDRPQFIRSPKLSGMIPPGDPLHTYTVGLPGTTTANEHYLAPTTVQVTITTPISEAGPIGVPQYAPTVVGTAAPTYSPATDCAGAFMSVQYQPNNNCYNYGCDIATNTFAQPGRYSGCLLTPSNLDGPTVSGYAEKDGLIIVSIGGSIQDCVNYWDNNPGLNGHFVALMISPVGDVYWPGDYHWARCDNSASGCNSWSQKDGNDQMTNFDFAGQPITDPSLANWTVNQGPISVPSNPATNPAPPDVPEVVTTYDFYCFMFVPFDGVNII